MLKKSLFKFINCFTFLSFKIFEDKESVYQSFSNEISFRTPSRPVVELLNTTYDRAFIRARIDCNLKVIDHDFNHYETWNENICHSIRVEIKVKLLFFDFYKKK
jgi:hypothetical protein